MAYLQNGQRTRVTFGEAVENNPVWSADGRAERLPQVIARIFARYADRPAFATRDGGPRAPYATVTYGEVWRRVA